MAANSSIAVTCDRYTELTPGPVSGLRTFRGARPEVQYEPMGGGQFTSKEERHQLHRFQRPTLVLGKAGEAALWTPGAQTTSPRFPIVQAELSKVALTYQGVHLNKIALVSDLECFSVTLAKTGQPSQEPKNSRSKLERRGGGASNPTVIGHHRRFQGLGFWPLFLAWLACRHCLLGSGARSLLGYERPICRPYGPASCLVLTLLRLLFEMLDGGDINSRRRISQELIVSTRVLRVRYEGQDHGTSGEQEDRPQSKRFG
ncbi:hypothetical protein NEUTE1DRAFT_114393 [Neurospora tetrasperma FGSC 2508]|uniref:Uncharacterized protein n=1 Tax=Neurospora tetrasperma (strain FGSC 2508 / ATCC MYA-4615 / P0657) TaxID=510951 RepID=F8N260_NEUT8|nr:uncharacterized protein NEUTE1DRAFT_114393 [Neurospora tetrasperma FGSC 2508]EGO52434.1 hypothetical protein NEUTE1DRAFT_114393 [Neurospora tetrasperma FGSC 2508]